MPSREESPQDDGQAMRILVVDDDRDFVLTTLVLLRDEGYEARGMHEGANVLAAVGQMDPDVVLLDIGMPDRNGYDVARSLRSRYGEQRPIIVAITAWTKPSDKMLAEMAGIDHHLSKPCDPRRLLALLSSLPRPKRG